MVTRNRARSPGIEFGRKLAHASTRRIDYTVTDDAKAFELLFKTALAAGVGSPVFDGLKKSKAPIGTAVFTAVIPATGSNVKAGVALNGFSLAPRGTRATVIAMANGRQVSKDLRASADDQPFTLVVPVEARTLSEIRLVVVLVAQQEGGGDASALVAVTSIGADTFVPKKQAAAKKA